MSGPINHSNRDTINVSDWKNTNLSILGQTCYNNSLSAQVFSELDLSTLYLKETDQNIHCGSYALCRIHCILAGGAFASKGPHCVFLTLVVSVCGVYVCAFKHAWHICISDVISPPFHMQINLKT